MKELKKWSQAQKKTKKGTLSSTYLNYTNDTNNKRPMTEGLHHIKRMIREHRNTRMHDFVDVRQGIEENIIDFVIKIPT